MGSSKALVTKYHYRPLEGRMAAYYVTRAVKCLAIGFWHLSFSRANHMAFWGFNAAHNGRLAIIWAIREKMKNGILE